MLKVMIVDNDLKRSKPLKQLLIDNGFEVIAHVKNDVSLDAKCRELQPDVVIMDVDSPSRDTLENICVISMHDERPIVMFSHDGDKEKIKAATQAGVSAYVVGTIPSERLRPVIDAAIARFEEFKNLRAELAIANTKLDERKVIERAKGLLMRQRNLDENEAYSMLRSMAMQRKVKLADLSKQLVEAAEMLIV
ncbi:MAG: ANTAR domain-containing protein [Methylotenera sp.]|nr:ANTAR domain-containing protein [Methylotenera sp.]NOT65009.1 ANTAR domain-containing protein [Methylotenera sp.]